MDMYISLEQLPAYAESTARTLPVTGICPPGAAARSALWALRSLRRRERRLSAGGETPTEAERWLLDNLYLAERAAQEAGETFHRGEWLRRCGEGPLLPAMCRVLLSVGGGAADEERCLAFLRGFQRKTPLRGGELNRFPAALGAAAVELLAAEFARETPDPRRAEALFTTLRRLSAWDMGELLEKADAVEEILRRDPAGVYPRMDKASRRMYRRQTERLGRKYRLPEHTAAERAWELAARGGTPRQRHIGYWLLNDPLGRGKKRRQGGVYIAWNAAAPVLLSVLGGGLLRSVWAGLLLWLPLTEIIKRAADRLILRFVPPRHVPRLELREGVPPEGKTICVISVLLTGEKGADTAVRRLEEYRMASRDCGENLLFGLLCDLPESDKAFTRADRALLERVQRGVEGLNDRYGGGFYLFSRERVWSTDTEAFAPWERKRGAVTELCRLLAGEPTSLETGAGDAAALAGTEYVLTLDSDTRLEPETARQLIGAALHPLNRPEVDPVRGIVTAGHGILHPRIAVGLQSAGRTVFSWLFAPQGGGDPYGSDAGEVYMDAFASGGFAGKGLIHVPSFLACLGGLPERRILSHDALEGAFLRGGYVSDVELTDGFPAAPLGWFARRHRWIRGDWQNLPWMFRPGRALPAIERWRLWDSLRRSLAAPGLTAALSAFLFTGDPALAWPAAAALLALFLPVGEGIWRTLFRPREEAGLRIRAGLLHGPGEELLRPLARLILLPFEGWTDLSAAGTALWRTWVSGKNRLQWQTAEQSEAASQSNILSCARQMWFSISWGVLLLGFAPGAAGKAAGCVWLLSPPFLMSLARPRRPARPMPAEDRDWLFRRAAEIWRFFREECRTETHFLPPDNVQLMPAAARAERISPTNLGLTLIAALSALELGLSEKEEALSLCEHVLSAAERMERWNGHFYNWYDTRTLAPLHPAYVSTVDSGNLWACLHTAAAGLRAHGAETLSDRTEALCREMDFTPLYDRGRDLFRIGLTPGDSKPAQSWYDLLESEERLTGYVAVASGQIPVRHWRRLGRAQAACDGFRGMVSWSGTMFEYLMPELFLPLYRDSHLWESARFAVYVQRRRAIGKERLWGMSESGFYALDPTMHYRYKAHGCPRLALCRGMERDAVIAPYASFLALAVRPRAAVENLRNMEKAGYLGKYGFWEAVDFTPSRDGTGEGMAVRSFMAHHLGMSLAAAANALGGGVLRRWFLSDPAMAAYTGLLQEKIPLGGALLRRRETALPVRGERPECSPIAAGEGIDFLRSAVNPMSNGAYRLLFTESGVSRALCVGIVPYASPVSPAERGHGMDLWLVSGGERISLLPAPGDDTVWRWEFTPGEAALSGRRGDLSWTVTAGAARQGSGEWRSVSIRRGAGAPAEELYLLLEPVLLPERDRRAHPSFARLGLHTQEADGALLLRRLARGGQPETYMALAADRPCAFSSDLRRFPGRNGGETFEPNTGWQSESRLAFRVVLPAGEEESTVRFALAVAADGETALASVRGMLRQEGGFPMAALTGAMWGLEPREIGESLDRLRCLFWPCLSPAAEGVGAFPRDGLWKRGVSGDVPIHAVVCAGAEAVPAASAELRRHALLSVCGGEYDLVFLTAEDGDYRRTVRAELERTLEKMGLEDIIGARGGVHFASLGEDGDVFRSAAALWTEGETVLPMRNTGRMPRGDRLSPAAVTSPEWAFDEENRFTFTVRGALPPRAWCSMLSGGELGWIASDAGTGSLWRKNARECPLIPWRGDPLSAEGPERLWAELPGGAVSFFARPGDEETKVTYGFGTAVWEKTVGDVRLRLTAFLPPEREVRVFLLESSAPCSVGWCAPVQLAPEGEDAPACELGRDGDCLTVENPRCPVPDTVLIARCSTPWTEIGTDADAFLLGGEAALSRSAAPALAGRFELSGSAVLLCGTEDAPDLLEENAARAALGETERYWTGQVCPFTLDGPEKELLPLLNGWSAYETLACRIRGRASLYQSGGAVGFRDQLQDYVNLLPLHAPACRAHILSACGHQYAEGDVQHWWHPGGGETDKGVRTRCSDDLLWLPWAVGEYVNVTGDETILAEEAPFLTSPPLAEEKSRYETPERSVEYGDVLEHCRRAAELVLRRGLGPHRLLKMGGGDWNDGFDAMGEGAESVWLTFFASIVFRDLGELLATRQDPEAEKYAKTAEMLGKAANDAWDGDHFLRGWYPDGTPLGGGESGPCRIDSVAQSFAAFCPFADRERVDAALETALRELWDRETGLIRLYAPAVGPEDRSPGYVRTYGPGFRENGGQYTHAAVWLARACFRTGRREEGTALLRDMARTIRRPEYGAEPFVLPADVYTGEGMTGRAGWTWYTGAAGWWHRTAMECLLGIARKVGAEPALSPEAEAEGWRLRKGKNS